MPSLEQTDQPSLALGSELSKHILLKGQYSVHDILLKGQYSVHDILLKGQYSVHDISCDLNIEAYNINISFKSLVTMMKIS